VGLPLALTFADAGLRTVIYDTNRETVAKIRRGVMPFAEDGARELLQRALDRRLLEVTETSEPMSECRFLVLVIGTPVDEHLNPSFTAMRRVIESCSSHLRDGQILILRSTIFPGISEHVQRDLEERGLDIAVAFCPERVAEGKSLREFRELPQIVSAFRPETLEAVRSLFGHFTPEFIEMTPMEAELCSCGRCSIRRSRRPWLSMPRSLRRPAWWESGGRAILIRSSSWPQEPVPAAS
jgi:UDP-N-acetyl-D-mannosaminuronic acid dehydrogenase